MSLDVMTLMYDYGGLLIGFALLVVASLFLPAKIRPYVLTAGLTLIVFRAWQIFNARKKLEEADAQREVLRENHKELQKLLETLRQESDKLQSESEKIKEERDRLRQESAQLDAAGGANIRKKAELDKKVELLLQESKAKEAARATQLSAIEKALALKRQFSSLDEGIAHE